MADENRAENRITLRETFRALRHRNYRLFFAGQFTSLVGTWIQAIAMSWLVYQMTKSAFLLGLVGFSGQVAAFLIAPLAGVFIDRWNQHRVLLCTQSLFMVQAFALGALVMSGIVTVWEIILLSVFSGIVNGFDMPTRQAFVVRMIEEREDLGNAIALNSSMFNGARLIGPAIAGFLVAAVGEAWCFMINGITYIAVIIALAAMQIAPGEQQERHPDGAVGGLREGFRYTFGFPPLRSIILLLGLVSLVTTPYSVLLPIFASRILHGDATTLGALGAAAGVGAFVGATYLASRRTVLGLGRWIAIAAGIAGMGLVGFGLSTVLWASLLCLVVVGFGLIMQMASSNTVLQTIVEDSMRGRVMSFYTMAFLGMSPFGSLLGGWLASRIGSPETVMIGGGLCAVGGLLFARYLPALRRLIHPIYCEMGILPAYLCGVQFASESAVPPEEA